MRFLIPNGDFKKVDVPVTDDEGRQLTIERVVFFHDKCTLNYLLETHILQTHPLFKLSPRELQVLMQIAVGSPPRNTGVELGGLSVKTISTYRGRIMQKLGMTTNEEVATYCFSQGFTKVNPDFVFGPKP